MWVLAGFSDIHTHQTIMSFNSNNCGLNSAQNKRNDHVAAKLKASKRTCCCVFTARLDRKWEVAGVVKRTFQIEVTLTADF